MDMGADQNFLFAAVAESALEWWREAGVDTIVDEAPRNWLVKAASVAAEAAKPIERPTADTAPARAVAPLADTLDAFLAWRMSEAAPDFGWNAIRIAPSAAPSDLMVLVEAPERDDEAAGQLLSGPAGVLFDRMLAAIGRSRETIHLASLAIARPLAGRLPHDAFDDLARIARHHVGLVAPKAVLVMGNAPSRAFAGADVASARGTSHIVNHANGTSTAIVTFHPRFLLERSAAKGEAWRDLQLLMGRLDA
ncbi:uracil-DNA glycosylase family protein [Sphingomonas sp. GlSt437]